MVLIYCLFFLTAFANCIYGVVKKKNLILYGFSLVLIFLLMTFNYDGPDIVVYRATYEIVGNTTSDVFKATYMEWGYTALMVVGNKLGLDFFAFRIILSFICLALFNSTVKHYKANGNFIVGLYMVYLFFFDTIQLRNCIIQFIILFATRYLFQKSAISVLKYILCIIVAASIHMISLLYLSLLLIRVIKREKGYKNVFALATVIFVVCVLLRPYLPQIISAVLRLLNRGLGYATGTSRFNHWIVLVLTLVATVPLYLYRNTVSDEETKNKLSGILRIHVIMGLFLPLCILNSNFNRIFRNVIVLDTIGLALLYEHSKARSTPKQVALLSQIVFIGGWLFTDLFRNRGSHLIGYVMECNLVYNSVNIEDALLYIAVTVLCLLAVCVIKNISTNNRKKSAVQG